MNFIQNVSIEGIKSVRHFDTGERGVLIQITDCGGSFPVSKVKFEKVFQFDFHDSEDSSSELSPQPDHGQQLVDILKMALEERRNVIVHCHAGLCRSGAVAEVGVIMGFKDTGVTRIPNLLVKRYMMQALGLTYDYEDARKEQWHNDNDSIIMPYF